MLSSGLGPAAKALGSARPRRAPGRLGARKRRPREEKDRIDSVEMCTTVTVTMAVTRRRAGTTKNVSVSLDARILKVLRERADSYHGGNLSAAIAEAAEVLHRQAARDSVAGELMRGRPSLTDQERRDIDAELNEGWRHARRTKKRSKAA